MPISGQGRLSRKYRIRHRASILLPVKAPRRIRQRGLTDKSIPPVTWLPRDVSKVCTVDATRHRVYIPARPGEGDFRFGWYRFLAWRLVQRRPDRPYAYGDGSCARGYLTFAFVRRPPLWLCRAAAAFSFPRHKGHKGSSTQAILCSSPRSRVKQTPCTAEPLCPLCPLYPLYPLCPLCHSC